MSANSTTKTTAEDRAMDRFCDLLIEKIETMQGDWEKPWISAEAQKYPRSITGRPYAGNNALMLLLHAEKEGFEMPFYATFNKIVGLNYTTGKDGNHHEAVDKDGIPLPQVMVNKGAKSFPVLLNTFTVVNKETKEKMPFEEYRNLSDEEKQNYNVYPKTQIFNVFNVAAQTNLEEARPELYAKLKEQCAVEDIDIRFDDGKSIPVIDEMVKNQLWYCPIFDDQNDQCYYSISRDEVHVVHKERFKGYERFVSTLMHECNHSVQASSRLGIIQGGSPFGSREYSDAELKAELGAALVCAQLGISKPMKEDSVPYLQSWLSNIEEDPKYLKTILGDVKRQVAMVNERLNIIQQHIDKGTDLSMLRGVEDLAKLKLDTVEEPVPFKRPMR